MKTIASCAWAALGSLLVASNPVLGQGTAFTYQGQLNANGGVANGNYDLVFALYATNNGGVAVAGPLTNSAIAVSNGLFATTLDFGGGVFNGNNYWLEIGAQTNGGSGFTALTPRQPITPAPYAIFAPSAGTAANVTGAIALSQLPGAVLTNNGNNVNLAGTFSGNGGGVTNLQLSAIGPPGTFSQVTVLPYFNSTTYHTGHYLYFVAVADINGDGKPDLITADDGVNLLTMLTNNGSGGFGISATPMVGNGPDSIAVTDVNGDGKPDLITANYYDDTLTVLTNNGSGGFGSNATLNVGGSPYSVVATNIINGVGQPDLLCVVPANNAVIVMTNDGSGVFSSNASLNVGFFPMSVVAADINGDGHPDLITANEFDSTLTVLTNNGSGVFSFNATLAAGPFPSSVVAADINGDGKPDLITANSGGNTLTVLTNNGSGVFGFNATLTVGQSPDSVVVADVNGDGYPDIISANNSGNPLTGESSTLTVLTNNGSGVFGFYATLPVGNGYLSVTAKDLNGDGLTDLICSAENDGTVTVLLASTQKLSAPGAVSFTNANNSFAGSFTGSFSGNGSGFTNLNASQLVGSFTLSSGATLRLSDQPLYLRGGGDTNHGLAYAGNGIINFAPSVQPDGPVLWGYGGGALGTIANGPAAILSWNSSGISVNGSISGNGSGLSNLNALQLTGGVPLAQLPAAAVTNAETGVTLSGAFSGDGSGLTGLNASQLINGAIPSAALTSVPAASLTGTVLAARLPGDVALLDGSPVFVTPVTASTGLRMADSLVYFRAGTDTNHGLGFFGTGTPNGAFGGVNVNGPVLWGNSGGVLGLAGPGQQAILSWTNGGVSINGSVAASGSITAGGSVTAASLLGNGGGLTNLQATNLTGPLALPQLAGLNLTNIGTNLPASYTYHVTGNTSGGFGNTPISIENTNTSPSCGPALRVQADGSNTPNAALSVSSQNTNAGSLIAQFGNSGAFVASIAIDGTVSGKVFNGTSDRNAKENFTNLNPETVLDKVSSLSVTEWNYKDNSSQVRHIGPVAQDFHAAFGLNGGDDKHISVLDEGGVALAAIQGLNEKLKEKDAEIQSLTKRLDELSQAVQALSQKK